MLVAAARWPPGLGVCSDGGWVFNMPGFITAVAQEYFFHISWSVAGLSLRFQPAGVLEALQSLCVKLKML